MSAAPRQIKAYAAYEQGLTVKPYEYTSRPLGEDDVEIAISHCGICGSDLHTISGGWGGANYPVVPGHEIIGKITAVGSTVTALKIGDRVGVGAMVLSCHQQSCSHCTSDDEPLCPDVIYTYNAVYNDMEKAYGGYAEAVRVSSKWAFKIPEVIPSDYAAPLLCAGVTVYKPLKENIKPGQRIGVVGIGGLGHLALQFAKALGGIPVAFSHSSNKEQAAREMGAEDFVVTTDKAQVSKAYQSVDMLLVTANAENQPFNTYLTFIKKGGKLVLVGAPNGNIQISPFMLLATRISILGSSIGGIKDTKDMLELAAAKNVRPVIEKMPMSDANKGIELVDKGKARYRVVLEN